MPKFYPSFPENLQQWALAQPLFFTASAPLSGAHVNLSPKGLPAASLAILSPSTLLYLDGTGSGCETISHLYENGRITIMFVSFDKSPRILRLFCRGRVIEKGTPEYDLLRPQLGAVPATTTATTATDEKTSEGDTGITTARAIIYCDIFKVQTSCGFGVPLFLDGRWEDRPTLTSTGAKLVKAGKLHEFQDHWNVRSLDNLPGLRNARRRKGEWMTAVQVRALLARIWTYPFFFVVGIFVGAMLFGDTSVLWQLDGKGFLADW
ncbi:hypothetical protein DRE_05236 [Drechslerella stenobrocha 248]|uniref:Pyridoxamine 5'-phosphate oxidase putative domain-containing protein n=1 Tax=Drechslerella stenobrocha 248 TaxID=1043628 RepID=W7I9F3_9PEZI|nr:hypothetical protein DRE_05236 [Drechslerella stenobrocha 248]